MDFYCYYSIFNSRNQEGGKTKTFEKWWLEKLGLNKNKLSNEVMKAGKTPQEASKIDRIVNLMRMIEIKELEKDKQIIKDRLRANLDGNTNTCIYEVKTYNIAKEFKVSKQYWRQAQVEMYASGIHKLYIVAYGLQEDDYNNYFNEIDKNRLKLINVDYDKKFIENEYLPKLKVLTECLKKGGFPEW